MPERIPATLARQIRLVGLDVDGVLTDGGLYMGKTAQGEAVELKRFEISDGLGIKLLERGASRSHSSAAGSPTRPRCALKSWVWRSSRTAAR